MLAGVLLALAACTATSRYRVLSFFFDGVPDPDAPPTVVRQNLPDPGEPTGRRQPKLASQGSVHAPYRERACQKCHAAGSGSQRGVAADLGAFSGLRRPAEELCVSCHEQPTRQFEHAPVLFGACMWCHHPHASRQNALLLQPRVRDLCVGCHNSDTMVDPGHHADQKARDCGACHDPHGGEKRYFLRSPVDPPADAAAPTATPDPLPPLRAERSRPSDTGTQSGGPSKLR